jgi:membrane fusion protein (multidrug efflux system)
VIKRLLLVVIALAILFGGIFGWKYWAAQKAAAMMAGGMPPSVIAAEEVRREQWQPTLDAIGNLVATQTVLVASEIEGQVKTIHFESGSTVEAGVELVTLDDDVDQAELAGLEAEKRLAEIQFERTRKLLKDKTISRSEYDEAKATLDNAAAQVRSQQARIARKHIHAPFSGQLGIRKVDIGQYLAAGDAIVSLQANHPIYADYSLPERYLNDLSISQAVEVRVQAFPGQVFSGKIEAISPRIETASRSVPVRAILQNEQLQLRTGMFAEVRTLLPPRSNVLTIPEQAISYNPYGDSVFVVEEKDGSLSVQKRQIETGAVRNGRAEVLSGLDDGERIVTAGHNKLRNGMAVTIDNSVELDGKVTGP